MTMPGITVSFVADAKLAARVKEIARSDGVTQSQAAARASVLGTLLPPAARRTLRVILEEGDDEARTQLAVSVSKAIAQVGNMVVERQLRAHAAAQAPGWLPLSDEELAGIAVEAVVDHRRQQARGSSPPDDGQQSIPARGAAD